jgi:hypothetical protein
MARELRQSTSVDLPIGPFLDAADGVTPETGLTITQPDVRLKKNSAAWAQKNAAQTLSHEENGFYEVTLDATDTNTLGMMRLAVFESGAAPVWEDFRVITQAEWDAKYATAVRPTAADIADAVWDEVAAGHQTDGTFGQAVGDAAGDDSIFSIASGTRTAVLNLNDISTTDVVNAVASEIADVPDDVWAFVVDGATTAAESMRLQNSALAGKASGMGTTTATFRDLADSKDRIVATVDANGNRTALILDAS